jgi:hypothetical protein
MKHFVTLVFLFITVCTGWNTAKAQQREIITLQPKQVKISSSIFSNVEVLDTRLDTSSLGYVHKGLLNRMVFLTTSQPIKKELETMVTHLVDGVPKQDATLLINLRQFYLSEFSGKGGENGVFRFSAVFYVKRDSVYRKVLTVNSNVVVKSFVDITQKLLDTVPEILGAFVLQAASFDAVKTDSTSQLTARHFDALDELEKEKIPVYNVDMLQKGLYASFEDFKNNRPSRQVIIVQEDESDKPLIYEIKENGKKGSKIKNGNFYAVSDGEKMFISGPYTLYPLRKRDTDFYFTGIGKDGGDESPIVPGQTIILDRSGNLPAFLKYDWGGVVYKIDHITGKFVPVRIVEL